MKQLLTLMTMVLMILVLAVGSYAQDTDGGDTTENYNNVVGLDGNGGTNRNGDENMDLDGGPLGDLTGIDDVAKDMDDGPLTNPKYEGNGGIHRNGGANQHPTDDGPHANGEPVGDWVGQTDDATKVSEDCTGEGTMEMKQDRKLEWESAAPEANGGINRRGAEFAGLGGPHEAGVDGSVKLFIDEDGDGFNDDQWSGIPQENLFGTRGASALGGTMSAISNGFGESSGAGMPVAKGDPTQSQSRPGGKK